MRTDTSFPDEIDAVLGQTLQVHKAEHISLAGARSLLNSLVDAVARHNAAAVPVPMDEVRRQVEPYFDRVLLEHRAGLLNQTRAAGKLMQVVNAAALGDAEALEAIRLPQE